tara:strand:+ start:964 stop:1743 length:780 start_codon:yes stop_codon:yes gene_type:complete
MNKQFLLGDSEVANFIVNGFHLIEPDLPDELNESIASQLDILDYNPGDAITDVVPDLTKIIENNHVRGAIISLLGNEFELQKHRHWHCKLPASKHMNWHQDGINNRDTIITRFLALYYPREVTADMGPTIIVPSTQFRNAPTDRMAHYTNIRGQIPLTVKAGTVALTHYDLWHGTAANTSNQKRHMIKFLLRRTKPNNKPSWNHNPENMGKSTDWNNRATAEDPHNILSFSNPLHVSQTDHYKEREIRQKNWNYLIGNF